MGTPVLIWPMTKKCAAPECLNAHYSREYCRPHYKRLMKGDLRLDEPIGSCTEARSERAAAKIRGKKFGPRPKAWADAISLAKRGRSNGLEGTKRTAATKAKISAANSGPRNGLWKGDGVGYLALHERARKVIGAACSHCGTTEKPEAALKRDAMGPMKVDQMMIGGKVRNLTYSVNLADYFCLCRPCHKKYDTAK